MTILLKRWWEKVIDFPLFGLFIWVLGIIIISLVGNYLVDCGMVESQAVVYIVIVWFFGGPMLLKIFYLYFYAKKGQDPQPLKTAWKEFTQREDDIWP